MAIPTRERFLEIEGVRIHWTESGESNGAPPVLLIHGLRNSSLSWSRVAPLLATDRRVLALDLPGHGSSDRPNAGYELDWYARITARWLESIGVESADVVGHSFGGGVAEMLLIRSPGRVRRLVLVAAGGLGRHVGWWLRLASLPGVESFGQPFMGVGTRLALRGARDGVTRNDVAALSRFNSRAGSARAFARTVRDVIDWHGQRRSFLHRADELQRLPPLLLLWGDQDTIIPIEQGRAFASVLSGALFETFEGCGHYLHNERPEAFARSVRAFLDRRTVAPARFAQPSLTLAGERALPWALAGG